MFITQTGWRRVSVSGCLSLRPYAPHTLWVANSELQGANLSSLVTGPARCAPQSDLKSAHGSCKQRGCSLPWSTARPQRCVYAAQQSCIGGGTPVAG